MAITVIQNLLFNGSKAMSVDGSVTPKSFSYTAATPITLLNIHFLFKDTGVSTLGKFGSIAALANGVLLQVTIGGVTTQISNLKDNADILTHSEITFGSAAIDSLNNAVGFGQSADLIIGKIVFSSLFPLVLNTGDTVELIVRDNLTNIDVFNTTLFLAQD